MKIIYTIASLDPSQGGTARAVSQLAVSMARQGHEVGLWAADGWSGELSDGLDEVAVTRLVSSFDHALNAFGIPDIVHDNGIWLPSNRSVARLCAQNRFLRVVSPHGMLEPWALNHKKFKKQIAWHLYQKRDLQSADLLHATAESEAAQFRKLGLNAPIVVVPNGVGSINPAILNVHDASNNCQLPTANHALFLSRVQVKKGLPMWVEAWARVRPVGWKMRVVGPEEDGHRAEVQRLVEKAGLSDSWSFEDALEGEEKWLAMAEADLFVLPTHSENFGIVVAEALAAQTPVLTTTGTPWAGLHEHDCGWWVEPTVDGLEQGLRDALSRKEDFKAMGERGRSWVEKDFGWEGIAEKMAAAYAGLLDR